MKKYRIGFIGILCLLLCGCHGVDTTLIDEITEGIAAVKSQDTIVFTYSGNLASPCEIEVHGVVDNKDSIKYSLQTKLCDDTTSFETLENGSLYKGINEEKKLVKENINQYPSYLNMLFEFEFREDEIDLIEKKRNENADLYTIIYSPKHWENQLAQLDQQLDEQIAQYQANADLNDEQKAQAIEGLQQAKEFNHTFKQNHYVVTFELENGVVKSMTSVQELQSKDSTTENYFLITIE